VPVERNYRVARGPCVRSGKVDLIARDADGTLVFVEVRARRDARHGGAAASIEAAKQQRLVFPRRANTCAASPRRRRARVDVVCVKDDRAA
jgi:putative endonuclease